MTKKRKIKDGAAGLVIVSVIAVLVFYIISPKHWWELTLVSPIPPIP